ncbi:MAG: carbohydrate porin [Acidobacteriaceae bacterium]|nr:carbohydrate porin [Acidobacteriaceae bacterium]
MNCCARIALSGLLCCLVSLASAQQAETLQQQLDQLKQQYEQSSQQMQQRITALEQQIQQQKEEAAKEKEQKEKEKENTVSATELATENEAKKIIEGESAQVGAKFQGKIVSEPSYDQLQEAETEIKGLKRQMGAFEFQGYFRSGYGLNSRGGQQVAFEAPGAGDKYRLGNEAETYGEFIFVNNWLNPNEDNGKGWLKTEVMFEANTTNSTNYANFPQTVVNGAATSGGNDQFRLREAFVRGGHFFGGQQTGAIFWAGERYYRRFHIEINDFYPLDLSGYGAGVEDFNIGIGKAAVAFLAGARPDITTQNGNYQKSNIDVRIYNLKTRAGTWGGWFDFATSKGGTTPTGTVIPTSSGEAFGFRHQLLEWHGGFHTFSVFYGTGAASNFSNPGAGTIVEDPTPFVNSRAQFEVTESLLFQPNDKFAIYPIFIFQRIKDGVPQHPWKQWVSFGARPEVFFSKYFSLAFEAGFDHTHSQIAPVYNGWLRKFTIAPEIGAGRKFFSRPVLRAFLTYGNWSNGLEGFVGGVPFQTRTDGFTYGVQAETWW